MNEHNPVEEAIDRSATELLRSNRLAARQEITDMAQRQHEQAALLDKDITLVQQLGSEAVRLYSALEIRESELIKHSSRLSLMDRIRTSSPFDFGRRYRLQSDLKTERYAEAIIRSREGDISKQIAKIYARNELGRRQSEASQDEMIKHMGHKLGRVLVKGVISAGGYEYYAPPVLKTSPETDDYIAQQWRVTAMLPCSNNKFSKLVQIRHEFKDVDDLKVITTHKINLDIEDQFKEISILDEEIDLDTPQTSPELFFALGVLIKSREAVEASIPKNRLKMVK